MTKSFAAALVVVLALLAARGRGDDEPPPHPDPLPAGRGGTRPPNRLAAERSPYLRQHADNPVDWYPWGDEAFERARAEEKPVFLSIGYSSCHWCHVMEHESFEDEEVAKALNAGFVSIKVDREERPDVDEVYMRACQIATGGHGGWPLTVLLLPDRRPFFAGTYFPKETFLKVLDRAAAAYRDRRADVEESARGLADAMVESEAGAKAGRPGAGTPWPPPVPSAAELLEEAITALERRFDERHGGFGRAPKFPPHHALRLLLGARDRVSPKAFAMATRTLDAMAAGGIHDHIGGGFHRYSTDEHWLVPHFEKMLYDNALLARAYAEAYRLTGEPRHAAVARGVLDFVLRELQDPEGGGFFSALDADSEGEEGRFYTWTPGEVVAAIGAEDGRLFNDAYDVTPTGNFEDVGGGRSVPHRVRSAADLAAPTGGPAPPPGTGTGAGPGAAAGGDGPAAAEAAIEARLARARAGLLAARAKRVRPALDDKVLTSWNGLTIGALARAGAVLAEPRYVAAAERGATFVLSKLRRGGGGGGDGDGRLLRSYRAGEAGLEAYLDDYAFLADGLLDVHEATGDARWTVEARSLLDALHARYRDAARGGYYFTADDHEPLVFRPREAYDGALPAGNAVAARALARLAILSKDPAPLARANEVLRAFAAELDRNAAAMATMVEAAEIAERAAALLGPVPPPAGPAPGVPPDAIARPVRIAVAPPPAPLRAGEPAALVVTIEIAEGFHVNAATPADPALVPTTVAVEEAQPGDEEGGGDGDGAVGIALAGPIAYPEAKRVKLGFSDEPLAVYEGRVEVRVPIVARAPGSARLRVTVRFQACDATRCLAPEQVRLEVPIVATAP